MVRSCLKFLVLSIALQLFGAGALNLAALPIAMAASEATVKISGMTCGSCELTVNEKVTTSPLLKDRVEACKADAKAGTVKIKFRDGMQMTQSELESAMG
ncbi:MAG: hypothetical protein K2X47_20705, partial [Bdellovibrionales bacterium]|nr:hypothetical protein [Bdellovibrionales bacterium]